MQHKKITTGEPQPHAQWTPTTRDAHAGAKGTHVLHDIQQPGTVTSCRGGLVTPAGSHCHDPQQQNRTVQRSCKQSQRLHNNTSLGVAMLCWRQNAGTYTMSHTMSV
jgi:hypothetical protein